MRYLYGDLRAFPLNDNFIETTAAATDAAVALLAVEERVQRAGHIEQEASCVATSELADIERLAQRVERALAKREHLSKATARVATDVVNAAQNEFDRAREGVKAWRRATVKKARAGTGESAVMAPLEEFMVRHELPYTSWGLRWRAGVGDAPVQAQVYAIMQRGLTATLAVSIPLGHLWSQPVRVGQLDKGLTIQVMGKGWLGSPKLISERLDRYYVTRVTRTTEREAVTLSRRASAPAPGLRIVLRDGDKKRVTITRVDELERPLSEPAVLQGMDATLVRRLWHRISSTVGELVHHRSQLLAATLYGKPVGELDSPTPIAHAIIAAVAPLVRDLQRHSRTPGELQLKRELGDGRREELFISNHALQRKYAKLRSRNRAHFASFGLEQADGDVAEDIAPRPLAASQPPSQPDRHISWQPAATHPDAETVPPPTPSIPVPLSVRARPQPSHVATTPRAQARRHSSAPPPTSMLVAKAAAAAQPLPLPLPPRVPTQLRAASEPPPPPQRSGRGAAARRDNVYELPRPSAPPPRLRRRTPPTRADLQVVAG